MTHEFEELVVLTSQCVRARAIYHQKGHGSPGSEWEKSCPHMPLRASCVHLQEELYTQSLSRPQML